MDSFEFVETPPEFFGRALFSEDLRLEASGQFTIVGTISAGLDVPEFPFTLPKLCAFIELQQEVGSANLPITVRGFLPGATKDDPYFESVFDIAQLAGDISSPPDTRGPYPGFKVKRITQCVVSQTLMIREAGIVQIRAFRDGKVYGVGAIEIRRANALPHEST